MKIIHKQLLTVISLFFCWVLLITHWASGQVCQDLVSAAQIKQGSLAPSNGLRENHNNGSELTDQMLDQLDHLTKFLNHPDPIRRSKTLWAIVTIVQERPEHAVKGFKLLARGLKDGDRFVQVVAGFGIEAIVRANPIQFVPLIQDPQQPSEWRRRVVTALGTIQFNKERDSIVVTTLETIASNAIEGAKIRKAAIDALGFLGQERSQKVLDQTLEDIERSLREQLRQKIAKGWGALFELSYLEQMLLRESIIRSSHKILEQSL